MPTSINFCPDIFIISGILNPPPISTDSDLDTKTSLFFPKDARAITKAMALLLKIADDSEPIIKLSNLSDLLILDFLFLDFISSSKSE